MILEICQESKMCQKLDQDQIYCGVTQMIVLLVLRTVHEALAFSLVQYIFETI